MYVLGSGGSGGSERVREGQEGQTGSERSERVRRVREGQTGSERIIYFSEFRVFWSICEKIIKNLTTTRYQLKLTLSNFSKFYSYLRVFSHFPI